MSPLRVLAGAAAWAGLLAGCFPPGEGLEPPLEELYFPVGLAKSPEATRLYVANSNFDLQYNGGAVQVYDLERLRQVTPRGCSQDADCASGERCDLEPTSANDSYPSRWCVSDSGQYAGRPCGPLGERDAADRTMEPGRCSYVEPDDPQDGGRSLIVDTVGIGAFATDVIYRSRPPAADGTVRPGGRLFIPVRGDATLHYIDVDDDSKEERTEAELDCGQDRNDGDCDDRHRVGDDPDEENIRGLRLLPEPFAIDATADGEAVVVTHQTDGAASLFVNDWDAGFDAPPRLEYVQTGMPTRAIGIAALPVPASITEGGGNYFPGFLLTFRASPEIRLLRYIADASTSEPSNPPRPYLYHDQTVNVGANAIGFDARGLAIDDSERRQCQIGCPPEPGDPRQQCLTACRDVLLRVFAANRNPSSVLIGETRSATDERPRFSDSIPLPYGPSRVVVGDIITESGEPATRVFVLCFDAAMVGIYDPATRRVEQWAHTGRGPHALVIDTDPTAELGASARRGYGLGYVGHFTDSYIGVMDLDRRNPNTYGEIILTVGAPTPPRASK